MLTLRHRLARGSPTALALTLLGASLAWLPPTRAAECGITGQVKLPSAPEGRSAGPSVRYKNLAPGKVGPAAGPVAAVYLEGQFPASPATNAPSPPQLEQKQFQFVPALLVIQRGARVEFPNRDDEYHNVLSYSKAKEFDLGRYLKGEKPPAVVFDRVGVVEVNCEIHEHMRAYILVVETPYFTTTDAEGKFRLAHLPPGKHVLKVWLGPKQTWQRPVELAEGATVQVTLPE